MSGTGMNLVNKNAWGGGGGGGGRSPTLEIFFKFHKRKEKFKMLIMKVNAIA